MPVQPQQIQQISGYWLILLFCLWPVIIHAGGLGFAALAILMGVAGWVVWIRLKPESLVDLHQGGWLVLFFVWMALSAIWSPYGPLTAFRLLILTAFMAAIPVLIHVQTDRTRMTLSHLMMATALGGIIVLTLDIGSGYAISLLLDPVEPDGDLMFRQGQAEMSIGRGLVVYALFTPLLIGLFGARLPRDLSIAAIILFASVLLIGSYLNRLAIPFLMLAGALPLFWIGYHYPKRGFQISLIAAVLSVLFSPLIGLAGRLLPEAARANLPLSWDHRVRMWDFSLARIQEHPLIGHGLESSRSMDDTFTTRTGLDLPYISLHPHNVGLQTWLELGSIGALLLCVALVGFSKPMARYAEGSPWRSGALCGGLMGVTLACLVTVGAWQYWWWAIVGLSVFLIPLIPPRPPLALSC